MNSVHAFLIACLLTANAAAADPVLIDLEPGRENYALHQGGELTGDAAAPISGERSVLADSREKYREWFEFFTSKPGLLEPGYVYHVTFKYRVEYAAPEAYLYALFRSAGKGWGKHDRGWSNIKNLADHVGEVRTGTMQAGLDNLGDYQLMLGINGDARVIVDDITITRGETYEEPSDGEKAAARVPVDAEPVLALGFEQPPAGGRVFGVARLTSDAQLALDAGGSLYADTTTAGDAWGNVLWLPDAQASGMASPFQPGYAYHITLRYHAIDKVDAKAFPYMLMRSKEQGHGNHDRGWKQWSISDGERGLVYNRVEILEGNDYYFILGIHQGAKIVFDDLVIRREKLSKRPITARTPMTPSDDNLVWEETFDGDAIDLTRWEVIGPEPRRGGFWMPDKAYLDGKGQLVLEFDRYRDTYSMGAIQTRGKIDFKYGYFETRMKLPREEGHWPGFWLFAQSVNNVGNAGRDGTEVDIVEAPWRHKDEVSHALHWDGYADDHASEGKHVAIDGINEGWHTYAVEWSPDGYIFFVDGKETWRTAAGGVSESPLHIIVSDEMGGWSGDPKKAKSLPDHTYIDYVRVYQTDEWRRSDEARRRSNER